MSSSPSPISPLPSSVSPILPFPLFSIMFLLNLGREFRLDPESYPVFFIDSSAAVMRRTTNLRQDERPSDDHLFFLEVGLTIFFLTFYPWILSLIVSFGWYWIWNWRWSYAMGSLWSSRHAPGDFTVLGSNACFATILSISWDISVEHLIMSASNSCYVSFLTLNLLLFQKLLEVTNLQHFDFDIFQH